MSGAIRDRAEDIRARAAAWLIERRDSDDWSEKNQADLDAWLGESPAHRVAYLRLDSTWSRADRLAALHPVSATPRKKNIAVIFKRAVAGIAVVAVAATGYAILFTTSKEQSYATQIGARKTVLLADGSRIELNTDTALRTSMNGNQRTVWVDKGEAFFQIRHDAAHPFVVVAGNGRITDIGTKFSVRRDADNIEVALVEGRARFDAIGGHAQGQSAELTPGDQIVANAVSVSKTRKSTEELSRELGWRKGVLVFDNLPLADVAASFNRYNRRQLVIAGADVGRLTIVGTFRTDGVARFSRIARDILGLQVTRRNDEIIISR